MRLFGYARTSTRDLKRTCGRCGATNEVDAETQKSQCVNCAFSLRWQKSLPTQRERISAFCDEFYAGVPRAGVLCEVCSIASRIDERPHLADLIGHLRKGDLIVTAARRIAWSAWCFADEAIGRILDQEAGIAFALEQVVISADDPNSVAMFDLLKHDENMRATGPLTDIRIDRCRATKEPTINRRFAPPGYALVCRDCLIDGSPLYRIHPKFCPLCGISPENARVAYPDRERISWLLAFRRLAAMGWGAQDFRSYLRYVEPTEGYTWTVYRIRTALKDVEQLGDELDRLAKLTDAEPAFWGDGDEIERLANRIRETGAGLVERNRQENAIGTQSLAEARWARRRESDIEIDVRGVSPKGSRVIASEDG